MLFIFFELWLIVFTIYGFFPTKDCRPRPSQKWPSWHERCAMIRFLVFELLVVKDITNRLQKENPSKWPNLQEDADWSGNDFLIHEYFFFGAMIYWWYFYWWFFSQFSNVFTYQIWSKIMFISKDAQCSEADFCVPDFFVRFSVFKICMIDFVYYPCNTLRTWQKFEEK